MGSVLDICDVSKRYTSYASNWERFASWFGVEVTPSAEFWPLQNLSFVVEPGQSLALLGPNGAGKSTLLKVVAGTVRPTTGSVHVAGRVSAIIELGLGFNAEFTGRQNVLHVGGLMGHSRGQLRDLMQEIEAFAEIGPFFDQPFRIYSSGMQARLAFALATAVRPEILIVDEVLSVGDSYFQHKCFDRIRQFRALGTSIILVSHAMGDVRALCDRVLLLVDGRVEKDGPPDEVVDHYNALIAARENEKLSIEQRRQKDGWVYSKSGTGAVDIASVEMLDEAERTPVKTALTGQKLLLKIDAVAADAIPELVLGIMIRDRTGHVVYGTNTWHTRQTVHDVAAGQQLGFELRFRCDLGPGSYGISLAFHATDTHIQSNFAWVDNVEVFDVLNASEPFFIGTSRLDLSIEVPR